MLLFSITKVLWSPAFKNTHISTHCFSFSNSLNETWLKKEYFFREVSKCRGPFFCTLLFQVNQYVAASWRCCENNKRATNLFFDNLTARRLLLSPFLSHPRILASWGEQKRQMNRPTDKSSQIARVLLRAQTPNLELRGGSPVCAHYAPLNSAGGQQNSKCEYDAKNVVPGPLWLH